MKKNIVSSSNGHKEWMFFFDFDNTLTPFDVFDDMVRRFAVDDRWVALEEAWQKGEISSRECLEGQLRSVRVLPDELSEYLAAVPLDPYFKKLLALLEKKRIPSVITSDSFSFIIFEVLRHNGIDGVTVYANEMTFSQDRILPSFPYWSPDCKRCAHCKKRHLLENADKMTVYIGDGLSDICPAEHADFVFAKARLLEHFRKTERPCMAFQNLRDVALFFESLESPEKTAEETFIRV